jgi:hypothetical protein
VKDCFARTHFSGKRINDLSEGDHAPKRRKVFVYKYTEINEDWESSSESESDSEAD